MTRDEGSEWVADKARETFEKIRELRKSMPQKFAWQREALEKKIRELQAEWWKECKPHFNKRKGIDPPFHKEDEL